MNATAATQRAWAPTLRAVAPAARPVAVPGSAPVRRAGVRSCTIDDHGRRQALRAAGLRLTVRGRWVVGATFVVLMMIVAGSLGLVVTEAVGAVTADEPVRTKVVQVMPGETMWQIAEAAVPGADVRATVDRIVELNGLAGAGDLDAGDYLRVPVGGVG